MSSLASERRALWVVVASATLTVMAGAILGPVVSEIRDGVGVSDTLAGLIITTHGAFIVLTSPLAGAAVDRFGPRRPYIAGLVVYAVGGSAGLFIDDFVPLLASRAVLGVGVAFVYTGITVLIYEMYEGARMDRALGLRSGANSVGAATWPLVGGALGVLSWNAPFGVYLVALPLGVVAFLVVPETGTGTRKDGEKDGESVVSVLRRRPALVLVYVLYLWANVLLYAVVVFYPAFLEELGVESSFVVGLYLAVNGVAGGVSATAYDRLKRRFGNSTLVLVAFVLWTAAFGVASLASSRVVAVVPVVLFGLGLGLVFPSAFVWVEKFAPEEMRGRLSSYVASFGFTGQFFSPVVFGPLVAPFGVTGVFVAAFASSVVGVGLLVYAVRRG
ncbi:MAG: MFS transporter [Halobacteriales archaeon]|nr:MFS transporter [Halobacteriales archaeon]